MLKEMGYLGLGKLALALILFLGPGYGLCSFFPERKKFDKTQTALLAFVFSASFWALLMAWLQPLGVRLSLAPILIIALVGWGIWIFRQVRSPSLWPVDIRAAFFQSSERILLWILLTAITLIGLWTVRNQVVGLGSDSYHHTLISQLIMDHGRLLENYQPVTDWVITFTYHFGFHVTAAVLGWLSGLPTHWILLVLGMQWIALAAFSSAFLTESVTGSRWGGLGAAVVTGVLCVFPTHMLSWGRYPQLAGLSFMAVFLGLFWPGLKTRIGFQHAAFLGLIAAGLGSMHYRASLMTMVGAGTLFLALWFASLLRKWDWKGVALNLIQIGAVTFLLFLPWAWHVVSTMAVGYPLQVATFDPVYFALERVGPYALSYPTNFLLLGILGIAILWGLLRRDWVMLWVMLWTAASLVLSQPIFAGTFMDFVSTLISGYIPLSVGIGWLGAEIARSSFNGQPWAKRALLLLSAGVTLWFIPAFVSNLRSGTAYVQPGDLEAIEWVKSNTPPTATFMVNLYHFEFSPDLVIALDAGYWLPLLTGRKTVSIPMSYMSEKFNTPEGINRLKELDALNGQLCKPEAEALLGREGVTHVFVGSIGGPISVNDLLNCPDFPLEFQHQSSYVFRFAPKSGKGPGQ